MSLAVRIMLIIRKNIKKIMIQVRTHSIPCKFESALRSLNELFMIVQAPVHICFYLLLKYFYLGVMNFFFNIFIESLYFFKSLSRKDIFVGFLNSASSDTLFLVLFIFCIEICVIVIFNSENSVIMLIMFQYLCEVSNSIWSLYDDAF
jgi:hypothetical protein